MKQLRLPLRASKHIFLNVICLFLLSCNNEEQQDNSKITTTNQVKKELNLKKFSSLNISENIEINWKNTKETKKDSLEIFEIEANEKTATKLQSNFLQNNIQYQIVTINFKNQLYSYLLEIFGDENSVAYPGTITKLDYFKGTLNVFSLKGENLGSLGISKGGANNISKNNDLDVLAKTINLFLTNSNFTNRIPPCNTPYFQPMQFTIDWYREVSVDGRVLIAYTYDHTSTKTELVLMSYPCDSSPSEVSRAYTKAIIDDHGTSGGASNFTNTILTDPSFANNPCLVGVFNKLGGSPIFQSYLKKFDDNFSVANLKLAAGSIGLDGNYSSTSEPINSEIVITFNNTTLDRPVLDIAKTFIHEMIHAEMYRQLLNLAKTDGSIDSAEITRIAILPNDNELLEYYGYYKKGQQHELMNVKYRETIISFLKEVDGSLTQSQYEAIAWQGLQGTIGWKQMTPAEQGNIQNTYDAWRTATPNYCK